MSRLYAVLRHLFLARQGTPHQQIHHTGPDVGKWIYVPGQRARIWTLKRK